MENYGNYRRCQYCSQREQFYDEPMMQPSYIDDIIQQPYNNQMMTGQQYDDPMTGQPHGDQMSDEPFIDPMTGQPYNNQMIGEPYSVGMTGQPSGGQMMGQSDNDQMIGQPFNYSSASSLEQSPQPTPYYQMYGYPQMLMEEQENDLDMERIKEMYPEAARHIMAFAEEECDKLEYEGSFMFDERPDANMLIKIRNGIYDKVKDNFDLEAEKEEDKDEIYGMNWERSRRFPPNKNWLGDMVDVLLLNEMFRRRCRFRNCCGPWC